MENKIEMAWSNGPLQESYLKTIEQYLEINFPKKYRDFLLLHNGGEPKKSVFFFKKDSDNGSIVDRFFGFVPKEYENFLNYFKTYKQRIPWNTIPIAYDPGGNLILLSVKGSDRGKIYFWDHEMEAREGETPDYSNLTLIADDFEEFINSLHAVEVE